MSLIFIGMTGWAFSAGIYVLMAVSVAVWGIGFAATNSMQQVRLVASAPPLAPASVSLNTSVLYVGQAVGSAVGGVLYAADRPHTIGVGGAIFVAAALAIVFATRPRLRTASCC
jgi:predicted MFS family arabinose efflux permease